MAVNAFKRGLVVLQDWQIEVEFSSLDLHVGKIYLGISLHESRKVHYCGVMELKIPDTGFLFLTDILSDYRDQVQAQIDKHFILKHGGNMQTIRK